MDPQTHKRLEAALTPAEAGFALAVADGIKLGTNIHYLAAEHGLSAVRSEWRDPDRYSVHTTSDRRRAVLFRLIGEPTDGLPPWRLRVGDALFDVWPAEPERRLHPAASLALFSAATALIIFACYCAYRLGWLDWGWPW